MSAIVLWSVTGLVVCYWLYVYMMGVYRAFLQKRLKGLSLILNAPPLAVAFAMDVLMQFTLAALVFWEWPRKGEWFVTHRLRRYMRADIGWRSRFSWHICYYVLDPFDPTGAHCDDEPPRLLA